MANHSPTAGRATTDAEIPSPTYTVPTRFVIGKSTTEAPLVSIQQIVGHLTLLHAFAELKNAVDAVTTPTILGVTLNKEQKWSWFVGCAVERFDIWCHALQATDVTVDTEIIMPPLDVIMVWHAYMLNPRWFMEDSKRRPACGNLRLLERQFTECLNGNFSVVLNQAPSQSRINFWIAKTSQPFEYSVDGVNAINQKSVDCHYCRKGVLVDLLNARGSGYLQGSFAFHCPYYHPFSTITKETLAVRKFAIDLAGPPPLSLSGWVFTASMIEVSGIKDFLISSLRAYYGVSPNDRTQANAIQALQAYKAFQQYEVGSAECVDALSMAIVLRVKFSMSSLKNQMNEHFIFPITSMVMSAYFNEQDYSVELVGAVLRQESFVKKMYDLGWTRSGCFDAEIDALALHHALARYHAFLDLTSSTSSSFFVPTLDIDLVWHTHQLMPSKYKQDCEHYVGRFVDHDDKVEGLRLSSGFDTTCRAWKSRFNVNYAHCGCPVPGDSIGARLSRLVGISKPPPPQLVPYDRHDLLSATHPSDHNAVRFLSSDEDAFRKTEKRYEKLRKKKEKEAEKTTRESAKLEARGKGSGLRHPHVYGISRGDGTPYVYGAFLTAVPMIASVGDCVGDSGHIHKPPGGGSDGFSGGGAHLGARYDFSGFADRGGSGPFSDFRGAYLGGNYDFSGFPYRGGRSGRSGLGADLGGRSGRSGFRGADLVGSSGRSGFRGGSGGGFGGADLGGSSGFGGFGGADFGGSSGFSGFRGVDLGDSSGFSGFGGADHGSGGFSGFSGSGGDGGGSGGGSGGGDGGGSGGGGGGDGGGGGGGCGGCGGG